MSNKTNVKKINKVMESRFGFTIDYNNLTLPKAVGIARGITEGLNQLKRSHGSHTAERNPKYMEMFMVRESLHRWMVENERRFIAESEMAKSEAILAAKDMVDSIQDMLEKISKMQNEQLPALLDTIRDQIGSEQAESFKGTVSPLLQNLAQTLQQGRESADGAARGLAGEQQDQPMDMGGMGADAGMGGGMPPATDDLGNGGGGDAFGAVDAAAGGDDELGRERRDAGGVMEGTHTRTNTYRINGQDMIEYLANETGAQVEMRGDDVGILTVDTITFPRLAKLAADLAQQGKIKAIAGPATRDMTGRAVPVGGNYMSGPSRRDIGEASKKKGDGNLANNAKPYDKVTRGDVIAGRLGKDEKGGKKPASVKAK